MERWLLPEAKVAVVDGWDGAFLLHRAAVRIFR